MLGAVRPENRLTARSIAPQKKCTGLTLPTKRDRNTSNTRFICTSASQNRCAWAPSYATCDVSVSKGIAPSISTGMGQISVDSPNSSSTPMTSR
jgi:hypothetical protein